MLKCKILIGFKNEIDFFWEELFDCIEFDFNLGSLSITLLGLDKRKMLDYPFLHIYGRKIVSKQIEELY